MSIIHGFSVGIKPTIALYLLGVPLTSEPANVTFTLIETLLL